MVFRRMADARKVSCGFSVYLDACGGVVAAASYRVRHAMCVEVGPVLAAPRPRDYFLLCFLSRDVYIVEFRP